MKKIGLLMVLGALLLPSTAEAASGYWLPYPQARKLSKLWVRDACEARRPTCATWKVNRCRRIRPDRVDCIAYIVFRTEYCVFIVENRVKGNGYITQRRRSTRCRRG